MLSAKAIAIEGVGWKPNVLAVLGFRDNPEEAERVMRSSLFTGIPSLRRKLNTDIRKRNKIIEALLYMIALEEDN